VLSGREHVLRNSRLQYSSGNGVSLLGRESRVYDNEIYDTNFMSTKCAAIHTGGTEDGSSDHEIGYNTIRRSGKNGITLDNVFRTDPRDGSSWKGRVHHNDISEFAIQDADSGGIYSGGDLNFIRIDHNWIHDAHPNVDNLPEAGNFTAGGIYPDFGASIIIDHNVVWGVEWAIHIQNQAAADKPANMLIYNNTCVVRRFHPSVGYGPFGVVKNSTPTHAGTIVRNNILVSADGAPGFKAVDFDEDAAIERLVSDNLVLEGKKPTEIDALFTNSTSDDFTLRIGSSAIDKGVMIPNYTRKGISVPAHNETVVGSAPDPGAYEFGGEGWKAGRRTNRP
jgi:hypothetical protein